MMQSYLCFFYVHYATFTNVDKVCRPIINNLFSRNKISLLSTQREVKFPVLSNREVQQDTTRHLVEQIGKGKSIYTQFIHHNPPY